MKKDVSFHDFVVYDLMSSLPDISSRTMMGGWCIYSNGIIFSLIMGNQVYFKAKGDLADKFISLGWTQFSYARPNNKIVKMCYWLVPDELIDNQRLFEEAVNEVI
jgi:DNA transformation protein